ncbi:hypothetical protein VTO73DRAFT_11117 [Trametes versicolor]
MYLVLFIPRRPRPPRVAENPDWRLNGVQTRREKRKVSLRAAQFGIVLTPSFYLSNLYVAPPRKQIHNDLDTTSPLFSLKLRVVWA